MAKKVGSTKEETDRRLDEVAEMMDSGVPVASIVRAIAKKYGVTPRMARFYVERVDRRCAVEERKDGPFIRARVARKAARFFAKCVSDGKHSAAAQALALEAKLSGAYRHTNAVVAKRLKKLGPPPRARTQFVAWAQELLAIEMYDAANNPSLDPIRRYQITGDFGAKIGLLQDKAAVEGDIADLRAMAEESQARMLPPPLAEVANGHKEPAGRASGDPGGVQPEDDKPRG